MSSSFDPRPLVDFARYYGFHYGVCDPETLLKDLVIEMERGLRADASNLPMLPSYIKPVSSAPSGKVVLALDAGGTNLRAARIRFDDKGKPVVEESRKAAMPGSKGQVSAERFFTDIADEIAPLVPADRAADGLGFCFSYPMETLSNADGKVLMFSKEVDAPELVGKEIGAGLSAELRRRGVAVPERIVLLNDTTAALLAGSAEIPADGGLSLGERTDPGPVIGFILGTGMNVAYPETRIPKIGYEDVDAPQIVVCETGNFRTRYLGRLDEAFDATTKNPGAFTFEKTMAGAYLGGLALHMLKQAAADGVLRLRDPKALMELGALPTLNVTAFLRSPYAGEGVLGALFASEDPVAVSSATFLLAVLVERAALFAAAAVAAAVERTGEGFDPLSPVRVAVEGTTFMVVRGLRSAFESHLHRMLSMKAPRRVVVAPVEQASLFGAAVAAVAR